MQSRDGNVSNKIEAWAASPLYPTVTTVLAVVAGALGSIFSSDIASAVPFCCWLPPWQLAYPAIGFWSAVSLLAYLFGSSHKSVQVGLVFLADKPFIISYLRDDAIDPYLRDDSTPLFNALSLYRPNRSDQSMSGGPSRRRSRGPAGNTRWFIIGSHGPSQRKCQRISTLR